MRSAAAPALPWLGDGGLNGGAGVAGGDGAGVNGGAGAGDAGTAAAPISYASDFSSSPTRARVSGGVAVPPRAFQRAVGPPGSGKSCLVSRLVMDCLDQRLPYTLSRIAI